MRRSPAFRTAAVAALAAVSFGCAGRHGGRAGALDAKPVELQTLADIQPTVTLPTPATQPAGPASMDALELYARGRDALLRNQKPAAIKFFNDVLALDAGSALVWRDLGYAQTGRDDAKAAEAFRRATDVDPADADSRLQLARLLLAGDKTDAAVEQLRLARLSPEHAENAGLAAVVDLLLAQCLEQAHYRTAALECYEAVLVAVDDEDVDLRGRPELNDVLQRPAVLVLRIADLAVQCGQNARAIELYQRLQRQEPQLAQVVELRLARAEMAKGDTASATRRAMKFVADSNASVTSLALFEELYEPYGGAVAALKLVDQSPEATKLAETPEHVADYYTLRSHLLLASGDTAGAVRAARPVVDNAAGRKLLGANPTLAYARQLVKAYRDQSPATRPSSAGQTTAGDGRASALIESLLTSTAAAPQKWSVWQRAWDVLTQPAQARPLTADRLLAIDLSARPELVAVRAFVASTIYEKQGRLAASKKCAEAAKSAKLSIDATTGLPKSLPPFDVAAALAAPPLDLPAPDVTAPKELAAVLDDYRDDPDLLTTTITELLQAGQKRMVLDAFAAVHAARPADVVIASTYAQVLSGDDRRGEAAAVLDKTSAAVRSANELYAMAGQYSGIGDGKTAERLLRKAHEIDATLPSVCNDLGYLLADQGRELAFAERLLTTAASAEPDNAAYLDSLGWLLYKRAKFDAAAERLEQAISASVPVDPVVLDHAGDAHYQLKKTTEAAERWQQAVDAIKERGTADPQLRLRIEQKLRQLNEKSPVIVAPVAKAD